MSSKSQHKKSDKLSQISWQWLGIILFLCSATIAAWLSFERTDALTKLGLLWIGVLFAVWLRRYYLRSTQINALQVAWILGGLGSGIALVALLTHDWELYPVGVENVTNFGRTQKSLISAYSFHPNVASGTIAALLPFSLTLLWLPHRRYSVAFLCGIQFFALLILGSRGAWVALVVAFVLTVLTAKVKLRSNRLLLASCITMLLLLAVVYSFPNAPSLLLAQLPPLNGSGRQELYQNSLILNSDYAVFGAGLATFPQIYASYTLLTHVEFLPHAHNLYMDIALEQGAIGLLAWLILLFSFISAYLTQIVPRHHLQIAAFCSLMIISLHGLIDDPLYSSRAVIFLFVPFAFASYRPLVMRDAQRWLAAAGFVTGLAVLLAWGDIRVAWLNNRTALRQNQAEMTLYEWPEWVVQDAVRREVDLSAVIEGYEDVLAFRPKNPNANRRLGQIYLSTGKYDLALVHTANAYAATPWHNGTRLLYGESIIAAGVSEQPVNLWQTIHNQQNQVTLRVFWYKHIDESEIAEQIEQLMTTE